MKNWPKIEEKINAFLTKLIEAIWAFILKITPQKVKDFYSKTLNIIKTKILNFQIKIKKSCENKKSSILCSIKYIRIEFRETLRNFVKKIDQLKKLRLKDLNPKSWLNKEESHLKDFYLQYKNIVWTKIEKIGVQNIVTLSVLFVIFVGVMSQIYIRSRRIFIETGIMRDPASISTSVNYPDLRPRYYKKDEKHLMIKNVRFPVYIGKKSKSGSITIDLTVTTSNKYTRAYLDDNHHLVDDVFNTKIEPIIPNFPLETEGKIILKNKIKKELNSLIKKLKIDGEIEDVNIHSITSG